MILGVLAALAFAVPASAGDPDRRDMDCSDFANQAAAQSYFDSNGGSPTNNFDSLDGDGDGVVCEASPCPCAAPGGGGDPGPVDPAPPAGGIRVVSVTDGDTIRVSLGGVEEPVRLLGIDTPEVHPAGECAGAQASASLRRLLREGERVKLISDASQANRDVYGRLLRYVEDDGLDVGRVQVERGWAQVYVFDRRFRRTASYRRERNAARRADDGAWRRCNGDFHKPL